MCEYIQMYSPISTINRRFRPHIASFHQGFMGTGWDFKGLISRFRDCFLFASLLYDVIVYQNHHSSVRFVPSLWRIFPIHRISPKIMEYSLREYFFDIPRSNGWEVVAEKHHFSYFSFNAKFSPTFSDSSVHRKCRLQPLSILKMWRKWNIFSIGPNLKLHTSWAENEHSSGKYSNQFMAFCNTENPMILVTAERFVCECVRIASCMHYQSEYAN